MTFLIFRPKASRAIFRVKNALIPQLIDADGRALHKDSESGPNSKIAKITNMTFPQNTAELISRNYNVQNIKLCQVSTPLLACSSIEVDVTPAFGLFLMP